MGDGFTTRVDGLRDAASVASAVGDRLRDEADALLSGTGDPGHAGLAARMRAFEARLGELADGFAEEGRSIGARLADSAAAYEVVDGDAAAGFAAWLR